MARALLILLQPLFSSFTRSDDNIKEEESMNCPYLQGTYLQSCKASRVVYIPSQFEFNEYCTHTGHKICPYYTKSKYDDVFIAVDAINLSSDISRCGQLRK